MKMLIARYAIVCLSLCLLAGCGEKGVKANVELDKLQTSFASAEPNVKSVVSKSVTDAKSGNYREAFDELIPLLKNKNLTNEQIDSLRAAMHELSLLFPPPTPSSVIPKG